MQKNPQPRKSQYSNCLKNSKRKATWTAPTSLFLSRMTRLHAPFTTNARMARIRKAQSSPRLDIMAFVARAYTSPPKPEPLVETAFANERRFVNHCGTTATVAVKQKPRPTPKHIPWLRSSCHILVENEAPTNDAL
jgi:hypothetical protein